MSYIVIEPTEWGEITHTYSTTKANDKFTFPRIMRMWGEKASRIYRVYSDSTCDILKGNY